jgi:L-arabinose isomerase
MFCPDWKNNRIFTSHMGEINPDICSEKPLLHEQNYIFSDTGKPLVATGCFKAGKAILTDLAPGPDGTFNLIAAEVEYVIAQPGSRKCNTGWFVPRSGDIAAFLEQYSKAGGTHHLTCSYNGTLEIIRDWALLMNWNFVEIN